MSIKDQVASMIKAQKIARAARESLEAYVQDLEPKIVGEILSRWEAKYPGVELDHLSRKNYQGPYKHFSFHCGMTHDEDWYPELHVDGVNGAVPLDNGLWKVNEIIDSGPKVYDYKVVYKDVITEHNITVNDFLNFCLEMSDEFGILLDPRVRHHPSAEEIETVKTEEEIYIKYPNAEMIFRGIYTVNYRDLKYMVMKDDDKIRFWFWRDTYSRISEQYESPFNDDGVKRVKQLVKNLFGAKRKEEALAIMKELPEIDWKSK